MRLKRETSIKLNGLRKIVIPILTYADAKRVLDGKGWNYINVYDLLKLKQAYIAVIKYDKRAGKRGFYDCFRDLTGEQSESRSIDEYLNALKCFNLVDTVSDNISLLESAEFDVENPRELYPIDLHAINKFYFSYIRFKYFHNWFLGNISNKSEALIINQGDIINCSTPIFSFSDKLYFDKAKNGRKGKSRKLIDSFFYESPVEYFQFDSQNEKESDEEKALMRFWDVYIEWGKKLGLVEKINLTQALGVNCYTNENKNLYLNYFINDSNEINLTEFIKKAYEPEVTSISLPELTINLAVFNRCSIERIKSEIVRQTVNSNHLYSLQRTSAVFINGKEFIYPKVGNAFVSHIYIRNGR